MEVKHTPTSRAAAWLFRGSSKAQVFDVYFWRSLEAARGAVLGEKADVLLATHGVRDGDESRRGRCLPLAGATVPFLPAAGAPRNPAVRIRLPRSGRAVAVGV